jgi:SlyX protein
MIKKNDTQARLDALEGRSAHQDQTIDELSVVAAKQWAEISGLKDRLNMLSDKLKEIEAGSDGNPGEGTPPPHY